MLQHTLTSYRRLRNVKSKNAAQQRKQRNTNKSTTPYNSRGIPKHESTKTRSSQPAVLQNIIPVIRTALVRVKVVEAMKMDPVRLGSSACTAWQDLELVHHTDLPYAFHAHVVLLLSCFSLESIDSALRLENQFRQALVVVLQTLKPGGSVAFVARKIKLDHPQCH